MKHPIMAALAGLAVLAAGGAGARPFTAKDMAMLDRVGSPRLSPDGHWLAYQVRSTDWTGNKGVNALWLKDLSQADAAPHKLEVGEGSSPRWSPDGRTLYFLSSRAKGSQVWRTDASGATPVQVTSSPADVGVYRISPDGKTVVFAALAYPGCKTLGCSADRKKARGENKAEGEVYDRLGVRFWDTFGDGRYQHLFAAPVGGGEAVALMGDLATDTPSRPEGDESAFAISPDGKRVIFAAHDPATAPGVDTRSVLYTVPIDGSAPAHPLFAAGAGSDGDPAFAPDGKSLAFIRRAGSSFGAARGAVMLADLQTGAVQELDKGYDRMPSHLLWAPDGRGILATVEDTGVGQLIGIERGSGSVVSFTKVGHVGDFDVGPAGIAYTQDALDHPAEITLIRSNGGGVAQVTHNTSAALADTPMSPYEPFTFAGWNGESVHGYVVKPYGWKPGLKYPVAFLIHGGPHGSFGDAWSYRWNPQAWAGMGYAVVMVDFHGSSGYGEAFGQSIVGHWGDRPLEDLQKGWAAAQAKYPWVDGARACALGGSYGGYMVDWIAGNWNEPWKCLVDHDGILDTRLMAFATDIPGFSEDETGAWLKDPAAVERFNPINHLKDWSKPILVIHGGRDYRVPFDQGLGAFTAAQRKGVPSQFLYFASENHWVLKPQNSVQWYDVVGQWMSRWIGDVEPKPISR